MRISCLINTILHITHNDADAIGCAIAVDKYVDQYKRLDVIDVKHYVVEHRFSSIENANKNLSIFCNVLLALNDHIENGSDFNIDENTLNEFKKFIWGQRYDLEDAIFIIPDNIFITDLVIEDEILDKLHQVSKIFPNLKLKYVDHHTSNLHNDKRYDWCYVQATDKDGKPRAACKLFTDLFIFDDKDRWMEDYNCTIRYKTFIKLINDISRYDTWLWKTEPIDYSENETAILIDAYGNAYDTYRHIVSMMHYIQTGLHNAPVFDTIITLNENKKKSYLNRYMRNVVYCMGYDLSFIMSHSDPKYATAYFAIIILPDSFGNDIMEEIYTSSERTIDVVIGLYPESRRLSFRRGTNSRIDLSEYAQKFNGGGHESASGATCDTTTFMKFMNFYYDMLDNKK